MKVESESEVAQLCLTPSDPMDCSLPGSSIHGIFQARVLEWGAIGKFYPNQGLNTGHGSESRSPNYWTAREFLLVKLVEVSET